MNYSSLKKDAQEIIKKNVARIRIYEFLMESSQEDILFLLGLLHDEITAIASGVLDESLVKDEETKEARENFIESLTFEMHEEFQSLCDL